MLYLTTGISEGMFGESEATISRKRISKGEAAKLLAKPYTINIFKKERDDGRYDEVDTLLESFGIDTGNGIRTFERTALRAGDCVLIVRVLRDARTNKAKDLRFCLWEIHPTEEMRRQRAAGDYEFFEVVNRGLKHD